MVVLYLSSTKTHVVVLNTNVAETDESRLTHPRCCDFNFSQTQVYTRGMSEPPRERASGGLGVGVSCLALCLNGALSCVFLGLGPAREGETTLAEQDVVHDRKVGHSKL